MLDIFFYSIRRKIWMAELDISEDYFLTCLYPRGLGNSDDVEHGFLRSGLLVKVYRFCPLIFYLPTIRLFVHFSHHRRLQRHLMSKNLKMGRIRRSRKRLHRGKPRRLTLWPFFIWMRRLPQEKLCTCDPGMSFDIKQSRRCDLCSGSSSSICMPFHNGLKSVTASASEAFTILSLIFSSLMTIAVKMPLLFWSGGIS